MNLRDLIALQEPPWIPKKLSLIEGILADGIIGEIDAFILEHNLLPEQVTVGISGEPETRLSTHGVNSITHWLRVWETLPAVARHVENHFVNGVGTQGGVGGDSKATHIYVFARKRFLAPPSHPRNG